MGATLSSEDDLPQRDRWARLRFAIIGPLLAAPPAAGELHEALTCWPPRPGVIRSPGSTCASASRRSSAGCTPQKSRRSGAALRNQVRRDIGRFPSLSAEAVAGADHAIPRITRAGPRSCTTTTCASRSRRGPKCPSYPSVRRYLKAQGLLRRRPPKRSTDGAIAARDRLEQREVRSYEVEHVLQLLHLDFHHGSRKVLTRSGAYVKPLLVGFIDDRSRFLCHAQWYTNEGTGNWSTACARRCRRWVCRAR
jgi:putative transposase